ncbi:MAG: nucleotidyl transferase AbiEii/AbiGii toxin family protein [Flavobacterium sp.]|uniref:nucleotidyl transferase AbiEii/AbiGii toxin family protein n=1 Tax=Flavobacterium sp. TaxID=239 RepID=UPI0037AA3952
MSAVSTAIVKTIFQLQNLPSLANFSLAGGTNLALQYNHRVSDDIDLFYHEIIGLEGFNKIQEEVKAHFGKNARNFDNPCDINDQYSFLRFFIDTEDGTMIKVDVLQNMKHLFEIEIINDIRLFSKADIGLYKLVSLSNRSTKKDIYDLDFITDEIRLSTLFESLKNKAKKFNKEDHKTIFDLDENQSVLDNLELLISFDNITASSKFPTHTHDNIKTIEGSKTWVEARISWRSKVRELYNHLGIAFPKPKGINI